MADASTLTPEQRQAILLHLQGGGDAAHAGAVANGAITPELAQQLALQAGDPSRTLTLPEMQQLLTQPQPSPSLGTPALGAPDPSLATPPDALQAMADAPSAAQAPTVASSMPAPTSDLGAARGMIGNQHAEGQELIQEGTKLMSDSVPLMQKAAASGTTAAVVKGEHDAKVGSRAKEALDQTVGELQQLQDDEQARYQQRQQRLDQMMNQMVDSADQAAQAAPRDFWADKSTPSRIFAIISQIAGGAANGLANQPGQPTPLDRVIQRDLDQQKLDFAQKSTAGNQASGIYNDLIKATDSDIAAFGALKIAAYKKANAQLEAAAASDPEGAAASNIAGVIAKNNETIAQTAQAIGKNYIDKGSELNKAATGNATTLGNTQSKGQYDIAAAKVTADGRVEAADKTARAGGGSFTPNNVWVIPGQEQKAAQGIPKEFRKLVYNTTTGYTDLQHEIGSIEAIWNSQEPEADKVAEIATHQQALQRDLTKVYNSGNRATGGAYDAMTGHIPNGTLEKLKAMAGQNFFFDNNTLAALRETLDSATTYADTAVAPFGLTVRQPKAAQ